MIYKDVVTFWRDKKINTAAELSAILDSYGINFAFHSGKIENDNITYHDTREIFTRDGVTSYTGDLRTLFEIRNSKTAYDAILQAFEERKSITEPFVKRIQKLLTVNTYDTYRYQRGERPGEYKLGDYVTGKKEVGALAADVQEELSELLDELLDYKGSNPLVAAAYFHAKFENIHPFSDGNGRTGRLLMNYFLLLHNHPPIVIHEEDRKDYYDALERFDEDIEIAPLVHFLTSQLEKTWANYLERDSRSFSRKRSLNDIIGSSKDCCDILQPDQENSNHDPER